MTDEHILVNLLAQLTTLSQDEILSIKESYPIVTFPEGAVLLKTGDIAVDVYFVISGCIRNYEMIEGDEKTWGFFTEGQTAANFDSIANRVPSRQSFVCTELTTVAIINSEKENELYKKHPRFETFCRTGMEQMMGHHQQQLFKNQSLTPEDRYLDLLNERPDLVNRVPQYQLASYMGIKPETLSRIRKRLLEKKS